MRSRLLVVTAATTTMVALAFVVPLALLVRSVAKDRALTAAAGDAQALAPVLAVTTDPATVAGALQQTRAGQEGRLTVVLAGGEQVGTPAPDDQSLELARRGSAFFTDVAGGIAFFLPVLNDTGTSIVRVAVPERLVTRGVTRSWAILAGLAVGLLLVALLVADRLAASVVRPVTRLGDAARRLGGGDLAARVDPDGPPEVAATGAAFNLLAGRVGELLEAEREMVADLSHRLRTPLTVLRMQADALPEPEARERFQDAAAELERAVSGVIEEARRPIREGTGAPVDLGALARERAEFWGALADDQNRPWRVSIPDGPRPVAVSAADLEAALDALLGNVFSHTADGTGFAVVVEPGPDGGTRLVVEDAGSGFGADALERGSSGGGSTGLGLDIARRTAEAAGGRIGVGPASLGGARITLEFPAPPG
jgi:signal transduction histidine kinase